MPKVYKSLWKDINIIHLAVAANELIVVQRLLGTNKKLIECTDENGYTPLHTATERGHICIANSLLERWEFQQRITATHGNSVVNPVFVVPRHTHCLATFYAWPKVSYIRIHRTRRLQQWALRVQLIPGASLLTFINFNPSIVKQLLDQ